MLKIYTFIATDLLLWVIYYKYIIRHLLLELVLTISLFALLLVLYIVGVFSTVGRIAVDYILYCP